MTGMALRHRTPWILWPLAATADTLAFILKLLGRLLTAVIALLLLAIGVLLTLTVVGAAVGIPLACLGFLLLIRSLF
jgi:hypothetical protein